MTEGVLRPSLVGWGKICCNGAIVCSASVIVVWGVYCDSDIVACVQHL